MSALTAKQERFCQEYVIDLNATQAAIRAGYAPTSAKLSGHNNITKYNVKAEIDRLKAKLAYKSTYTQEVGLQKLLHAYDVAEGLNQPAAMVSAAIGANRMHGFDKDANIGEKTVIIIGPKAVQDSPKRPQLPAQDVKQIEGQDNGI
jgi:phage terminase small subunit